ncbi:MAG: hypothetical protein Q8P83_03725 [bacterium]|nr:hypothetical protein [bacterium]
MKDREISPQARREQLTAERETASFDIQSQRREIKQLERSRHRKLTEKQNAEIDRLISEREIRITELEQGIEVISKEVEAISKSVAVNPDKQ